MPWSLLAVSLAQRKPNDGAEPRPACPLSPLCPIAPDRCSQTCRISMVPRRLWQGTRNLRLRRKGPKGLSFRQSKHQRLF